MAGSKFFALLDDIATILDDVALMSKVAAKKTAGVLGDDLALNAEQVSGVAADRELPVVWAVAKGSFINKAILVPAALAISLVLPSAITPLLMLGGLFLCYEGCEKLVHKFFTDEVEAKIHHRNLVLAVSDLSVDIVAYERDKIKGAIRTDFILSAEIIVITLGTMADAAFRLQIAALTTVAILVTVGVYGLVAGIVKLDDLGMTLIAKNGSTFFDKFYRAMGRYILILAPKMMKSLSVIGTAAMFMVGGGILAHGAPPVHHAIATAADFTASIPGIGRLMEFVISIGLEAGFGIICGGLVVCVYRIIKKTRLLQKF